jgi:hypothetical protein
MHEQITLMHTGAPDSEARAISSGLPADLLSQSAGRLRVLALLYAFVFFMGGIFPALVLPDDRPRFLGSFVQWGPGVIGILRWTFPSR